MNKLLITYLPELLITLAIWALVGWKLGLSAFLLTVMLSILEITLSADNAVLNSRILMHLSVFWQRMFLTVGIIFAVFVVRFVLPILMVAAATLTDVGTIFSLAINNPDEYGHKLHDVGPIISAFGGIFLLMVGIFFFLDKTRTIRQLWFRRIEGALLRIAKRAYAKWLIVFLAYGLTLLALPADQRGAIAVAMAIGIGVYSLMHTVTGHMPSSAEGKKSQPATVVGWAAFSLFMYLQVLDASFSLDGVIGAFAITNNIIVIMAGLGIGALWVRTMTIYMVRHDTLLKYKYLESGAHWAILALSGVMFLKIFHIELPELAVGVIGLVFVAGAIAASIRATRLSLIQ